jgi:type II secretory pathway pseudopilin PulG
MRSAKSYQTLHLLLKVKGQKGFTPHLLKRKKEGIFLKLFKKGEGFTPTPERGPTSLIWAPKASCPRLVWGFTLVEAIVGIFIFSLIIIVVGTFQKDIFFWNTLLSNSIMAQEEARRSLKTMSAEIRSASLSSIGAYPIEQVTANSFIFYSDIDNDQLKERIRYFLDANILKKGVIKPSGSPYTYNPANEKITELTHYIVNGAAPIFSYYDKDYDGTTSPLSSPVNIPLVRLVKITILIDRDIAKAPGPVTLTTQVSMRNLRDNL